MKGVYMAGYCKQILNVFEFKVLDFIVHYYMWTVLTIWERLQGPGLVEPVM